MELAELVVVVAPFLIGVPVLIAAVLHLRGAISVSRWAWAGFIVFALLAFVPLASLVGYLVTAPLPWRPRDSGLVIAPVAFVLAIVAVKYGARINTRHKTAVRWAGRAGAILLGLFAALVWLFNVWSYSVHSD